MKLSTERKHLTNVLKMIAYQVESDLVELVRPHYKRAEDEGRTLIQSALQDTAAIEPTNDQLRIMLAPLSSPHRSRVLEALCEMLNKTDTLFRALSCTCVIPLLPLIRKQKADRFPINHVRSSELTCFQHPLIFQLPRLQGHHVLPLSSGVT